MENSGSPGCCLLALRLLSLVLSWSPLCCCVGLSGFSGAGRLTREANAAVSPTSQQPQGRSSTGVLDCKLPQRRPQAALSHSRGNVASPGAPPEASAWFWGVVSATSSGRSPRAGVLPGLGPQRMARPQGTDPVAPGGLWGQQGILDTGRNSGSFMAGECSCQVSSGKGGEKATNETAIHTET